jgi:hypothetical protein
MSQNIENKIVLENSEQIKEHRILETREYAINLAVGLAKRFGIVNIKYL